MARGWESKSVEAQQAEASEPGEKRSKISPAQAARLREKESLRLSRQRVLEQIKVSQNPRHRAALDQALADLDARLKALEQ